jgi:hypothetical protein
MQAFLSHFIPLFPYFFLILPLLSFFPIFPKRGKKEKKCCRTVKRLHHILKTNAKSTVPGVGKIGGGEKGFSNMAFIFL